MGAGRLRRLGRDLRAVGPRAPIRVAYELSRRGGLHPVVFGRLARRDPAVDEVFPTLALPPIDRVPDEVRRRTWREADTIARGCVHLFSIEVQVGPEPDWHAVRPGEPGPAGRWPSRPWWTIELRAADRPGDVKWAWELGRHRHLVVLARAAALDPSDARWLDTLTRQLASFIDHNPPEIGVHWYSSLELGLRAFAWLEIISRVGDRLPPDLRRRMARLLWHSGAHILAELPYSISSMQNNHLLGEAAALVTLGRALDRPRWEAIGQRLFDRQLAREFRADGSTLEESLSYQRFVMDIVTQRVLSGTSEPEAGSGADARDSRALDASRAALRHGAGFLTRLGVLDGAVPQFGDWDEGRALSVTGDPADFTGTVQLARALGGGDPAEPGDPADESAWYGPLAAPTGPASAGAGRTVPTGAAGGDVGGDVGQSVRRARATGAIGRAVGGGMTRATAGGLSVWLRAGPTRWHAHADLCSIAIRLGNEWLVGDPGTGSYNGDDDERVWFRSSGAHAVLELDHREQVLPHRAFRWQHDPWCAVGMPLHDGDTTVLWAAHDAYPATVARAVAVRPGEVTIMDAVAPHEGEASTFVVRFPTAPEALVADDGRLELPSGASARLWPPTSSSLEVQPSRWSTTYGAVRPAQALVIGGAGRGPITSSLTLDGPPSWRQHAGGWQRGDTRVSFRWRGTVIELRLESPRASVVRELRRAGSP